MRSCWKVPFIAPNFFKNRFLKRKIYKIKIRHSIIPYIFSNRRVLIYNGRFYSSIDILSSYIGFRFGDFCLTKTSRTFVHIKKKVKKKSKKK